MCEKCRQESHLRGVPRTPKGYLRVAIAAGLMAVGVAAVLYLAPLPDQIIKSCDRRCHDLEWPMICRIKLHIEMPQLQQGLCENCSYTTSHCTDDLCSKTIDSDLQNTHRIMANRQFPGPNIEVCQNDIVLVDVINKVPGRSLTLHWRGQPNTETPFMDGVPMVTQCPISSFTTFQYKFRASSPGTHFYHAYSDSLRSDGLFGALIVRQSDKREPHRELYDEDDKRHVILINEWRRRRSRNKTEEDEGQPNNVLLVNGKAPLAHSEKSTSTLAHFSVKMGRRYRFRLAFTGSHTGCPVTLSIDDHQLKIISTDGNPTSPYEATSVTVNKGERLDFILRTKRKPAQKSYFLRVRSECCNENYSHGLGVIRYERASLVHGIDEKDNFDESYLFMNKYDSKKDERVFDTSLCKTQTGKVCLSEVKSLHKMPVELTKEIVDRTMFLAFGSKILLVEGSYHSKVYGINNLTFTFPSSPLVSQLGDVASETMCYHQIATPGKCTGRDLCECVHLDYIPLGSTVEVLLINQDTIEDEHIFHLHGHHFYVVGYRQFEKLTTLEDVGSLNIKNSLFKRNFDSPVLKDTIRVPRNTVVALRFSAKNAGFWMLRDENSKGWTRGMDVIFQVGYSSQISTLPSGFPLCGDFIGPHFSLI